MPEPGTLLLFAAAALVLIAVPGPNLLYIAARSMADCRRAGLASVLGVETGTLLHVAAAAAGLSALLASSAVAFAIVKYAGAAYLVVLGIRVLLADDPPAQTSRPASGASSSCSGSASARSTPWRRARWASGCADTVGSRGGSAT